MKPRKLIPLAMAVALTGAAGVAAAQSQQGQGMGPGTMMGQSQGMGPGTMMGQGMGRGMMMGRGAGMGPGYGRHMMWDDDDDRDHWRHHRMMHGDGHGWGPMGGMMGGRAGMFKVRKIEHLSADDVRHFFDHWLERYGNPRLTLGEVTETDEDTISVEIVTPEGSLVDRFAVDRHSGWANRAQ